MIRFQPIGDQAQAFLTLLGKHRLLFGQIVEAPEADDDRAGERGGFCAIQSTSS